MSQTTGNGHPMEGEPVYVKEGDRTTVGRIKSVDTETQETVVEYDRGRSEGTFGVETENEGFPTLEKKTWKNGGAELSSEP